MNRAQCRELALLRLREAQVLFDNRLYSGAYYLGGYAIECALKACICRKTKRGEFPLDRKSLEFVYTHDLQKLVKGAELEIALDSTSKTDRTFNTSWAVLNEWSEEARYQRHSRKETQELLRAISDPDHGIMQWLQNYW
jgi:hypothetical protein